MCESRTIKHMRLVRRAAQPQTPMVEVSRFVEEGYGYRVFGLDGKELGYFGPDEYESIVFEVEWRSESEV